MVVILSAPAFKRLLNDVENGEISTVIVKDMSRFGRDHILVGYYYRLKIEESLQDKEDECRESFDEVERHCDRFNNDGVLSYFVTEKANQFVKELKEWDKLAQPLQVNMQYHGGEDEESSSFVYNIRNRVIDIVNSTQEVIGRLLNSLNQSNPYDAYIARYQAVQQLPDKLKNSITVFNFDKKVKSGDGFKSRHHSNFDTQ